MRKRILSMILVLTVTFGTCGVAWAAEDENDAVKEGLRSYGRITYRDKVSEDTVVIDSQDFYKLEERIDLFKRGVTDQLNLMHTYFTTGEGVAVKTNEDICIVHEKPSDDLAVNPINVDFSTILEGIAASQSVPSDVTAYGYSEGTELYKNADGLLTTDGTEKGAEQISITAASAENLSAGTAAWVNGSLVLGTGEDNKTIRDSVEIGSQKHMIDIKANGSRCVVSEDISGAVIYLAYNSLKYDGPSFSAPDGSNVSNTLFWSSACNHGESHDRVYHYNGVMWFMPKLKAGTVITVPGGCSRAYLYYFTK